MVNASAFLTVGALTLWLGGSGCGDPARATDSPGSAPNAEPSITASSPAGVPSAVEAWTWPLFESSSGAFVARFPGQPTSEVASAGTSREDHSFVFAVDSISAFMVSYTDFPAAPDAARAEQLLDNVSTVMKEGTPGGPMQKLEKRTIQGYPARYITRANTDPALASSSTWVVIYAGRRAYRVVVVQAPGGRVGQTEVDRFIDSFKIVPEQLPGVASPEVLAAAERVKTHRTLAGTASADGWYPATSTDGRFSVALPAPFNDVTIPLSEMPTGQPVFLLGATSSEAIKCVAIASVPEGVNASPLDTVLARIATERRIVSSKELEWRGSRAIEAHIADSSGGGGFVRLVRTKRHLYSLMVDYPAKLEQRAREMATVFFDSLEVAK